MIERPDSSESKRLPLKTSPAAVWSIVALASVAIIVLCIHFLGAPAPVWVTTTEPVYTDLETSVTSNGRVVPEHEFVARAAFPGALESVDVHLGQVVAKGQSLIRMKDPYAATRVTGATAALQATEVGSENMQQGGTQEERINLQNDLVRAQAEQRAAQSALATFSDLQRGGAASSAEVNAAKERLANADHAVDYVTSRLDHRFSSHDVASWKAKVSDAQSNLASARASFANINITSPIAGTVYLLPVTSNDFVGVGAELLRVADLQRLEVHANFEEAEIGKLREGAETEITWDGKPGRVWHGVIKHAPLAAVISGVRSVGEAIISINDVHDDLPPNATVAVKVIQDRRRHVLTLPREALHTKGAATYVYVVADDKLIQRAVSVGLSNIDQFQVMAGVGPQDRLALHAQDNRELFDGMQIRVQP